MQADSVHCLADFHSPNTRLSLLKRVFLLRLMVADLFQCSASLREMRALLALALPMMVAQIAQVATGFVDTVMAGRVGTADLAAVSLGSSILITVTITFAGLLMALNPIIAHHFGAQEHQRIGSSFRQGLWMGLALGMIGLLLTLGLAYTVPDMLGVESQVAEQTKIYLIGAALGVPGFLLFRVFHATSSSLNHTKPIMVVSVLALILNVPLNYFFIHGWFGLPALGGAGCGWATGLVFWFSALTLGGYVAWAAPYRGFKLFQHIEWPDLAQQRNIVHLGAPIALSFFLEVSAFSFVALFVAQLGTVVVASHQVVINVSSLLYMIPQSLGTALSVRVGQAIGAGDYQAARFKSRVGVLAGLLLALLTALLILLGREGIARGYSPDPQVIELASALLLFAALFQIVDATQTIASGALRGYKITTIPMVIHAVSFWGVGLGMGVWFGLYLPPIASLGLDGPLGAHGFWLALTISLTLAAILLVSYLNHISRQRLHRQRSTTAHQ